MYRQVYRSIFFVIVLFGLGLGLPPAAGDVIYVDDSATAGLDNGSSWENAYIYLQDALRFRSSGDEIRVGAGTYRPDQGGVTTPNDPTATFQLITGVTLRGGYAGVGAADPNVHDVDLYETILSGDIGTPAVITDNSYHVVKGNGTNPNTILEGFTITGGYAKSSTPNDQGGGMYIYQGSPTVINCTFSGNTATSGGGMYNEQSSPEVTDCTITDNSATGDTGHGGGMYNNDSSPTVNNCDFISNLAGWGGGMYNLQSSPTITNCTFIGNLGRSYNQSDGGGLYNIDNSHPIITNCVFSGNSTNDKGGAIYDTTSSGSTITNCTFSKNEARLSGSYGGAICSWYDSDPNLTNCIVWGNTASNGSQIYDGTTSLTIVTYSDVQGGWSGVGNINTDPQFFDADGPDDTAGTVDDDLRLAASIPCADAGDNDAPLLLPTDLAGNPRVADGNGDSVAEVDMGAFEFLARVHNITEGLWHETIQKAIDYASVDVYNEIEALPGTYYEAIDFIGKAIHLYSSNGPEVTIIDGAGYYHVVKCINGEGADTVLEGFTITGGNANGLNPDDHGGGIYNEQSSPTVTNCTISGNSAGYGGGMFNWTCNPTVTNCTFSDNSVSGWGGGMYNNDNSNPLVTNCAFSGNSAGSYGGGIYNWGSSPTVTTCTFSDNSVHAGGGMYNVESSSPTVTNCIFNNNSANAAAGGMYNHTDSSPMVSNCFFSGNKTLSSGSDAGGMFNYYNCHPIITQCVFSGNTSRNMAGGIYDRTNSGSTITNCTFSNNSAQYGGGICCWENCDPNITNCIFWGNTATENGPQIGVMYNSSLSISYSDLAGGAGDIYLDSGGTVDDGGGNIQQDPQFVDADGPDDTEGTTDDDLRLEYISPCLEAGDSTVLLDVPIHFDLDGNNRYTDVDNIANTGVGPFEFVDMGAYEFSGGCLVGDLNCDGKVDLLDWCIFCEHWLEDIGTGG